MAVQQNKQSKARIRSRKGANHYEAVATTPCPMCGGPRRPHRVCPNCGNYKGRQVLTITAE